MICFYSTLPLVRLPMLLDFLDSLYSFKLKYVNSKFQVSIADMVKRKTKKQKKTWLSAEFQRDIQLQHHDSYQCSLEQE